ncbi:hypothetical protein OAU50_07590 [Planctomycetota bacterium]|nr:hypothetical protein [Planctomycetota bacterium]
MAKQLIYGVRAKVSISSISDIHGVAKELQRVFDGVDVPIVRDEYPPHELTGGLEALGFVGWLTQKDETTYLFELESKELEDEKLKGRMIDVSPWLEHRLSILSEFTQVAIRL